MRKIICLLILMLLLCLSPTTLLANNWSLSPATTSPLVSSQFTRFDGYGFELEFKKLNLGLFWVSHNSHEPGQLLQITDGVYTRSGTFLELNYRPLKLSGLELGFGINNLSIYPEYLGYQLFIQRTFEELAFIRLGYRVVKDNKAVAITLGVDLFRLIEKFRQQVLMLD